MAVEDAITRANIIYDVFCLRWCCSVAFTQW